jgi:hypothetical protein
MSIGVSGRNYRLGRTVAFLFGGLSQRVKTLNGRGTRAVEPRITAAIRARGRTNEFEPELARPASPVLGAPSMNVAVPAA